MNNLPSTFDWLVFFFGGAFGSILILGFGKFLDNHSNKKIFSKDKNQVSKALNTEVQSNIDICNKTISSINKDPQILTTTIFDYLWIQTYSNKYIDFTNEDSLHLYSLLSNARKSIQRIDVLQVNLRNFANSNMALTGNISIIESMNKDILQKIKELKSILKRIIKLDQLSGKRLSIYSRLKNTVNKFR